MTHLPDLINRTSVPSFSLWAKESNPSIPEDLMVSVECRFSSHVAPPVRGAKIVEVIRPAVLDGNDVIRGRGSIIKRGCLAVNGELANLARPAGAFKRLFPVLSELRGDDAGGSAGAEWVSLQVCTAGSSAWSARAGSHAPDAVDLRSTTVFGVLPRKPIRVVRLPRVERSPGSKDPGGNLVNKTGPTSVR